jgi:hypothetical protein
VGVCELGFARAFFLLFLLVAIVQRVIDSLIGTNYGGVGRASCFVFFELTILVPYIASEFHCGVRREDLFL